MAAIPTLEEEDARRPNRERENLLGERTRIVNRMRACQFASPGPTMARGDSLRCSRKPRVQLKIGL